MRRTSDAKHLSLVQLLQGMPLLACRVSDLAILLDSPAACECFDWIVSTLVTAIHWNVVKTFLHSNISQPLDLLTH